MLLADAKVDAPHEVIHQDIYNIVGDVVVLEFLGVSEHILALGPNPVTGITVETNIIAVFRILVHDSCLDQCFLDPVHLIGNRLEVIVPNTTVLREPGITTGLTLAVGGYVVVIVEVGVDG